MTCNNGFESTKKPAKRIPLSKKKVALSKKLSGIGKNCLKMSIKRFQSIITQKEYRKIV